MSLYKAFFKIIKKNLVGILINLGITIVILMMLNGIYADNESKKAKLDSYNIYVENEDDSEYADEVVGFLKEFHKVKDNKLTEDQIKDLLYYEQIVAYIRIPKGFGEAFAKNGENRIVNTYDDSMPMGIYISIQLDNYLNALRGYVDQGISVSEASQKTKQSLDITQYVSIQAKEKEANGAFRGNFNYLPYGIISILIMGVFPTLVSFNRGEKKNRIQVSSITTSRRNGWLFAAGATFAMIVLVILVTIASLMGGESGAMPGDVKDPAGSGVGSILFTETWWLAVINAGIFTLVVAMMVSMLVNIPFFASASATAFSNIIGLSFCFLGGTFVPLSILGEGVTKIGRFLPNYWYSTAVTRIFDGGNFADVWDCFALELAFGLVCLFIGLAAARISNEQKQMA